MEITEESALIPLKQLMRALQSAGLELIEDKKVILTEKIKRVVIQMVHYSEEPIKVKFSDYLSEKMEYNYTYLANIFSEIEGMTLEQYVIMHRIERVKEFLIYGDLNLTQISYILDYSSVAHLSKQFKKVVGITPSTFKKLKQKKRIDLDKVGE